MVSELGVGVGLIKWPCLLWRGFLLMQKKFGWKKGQLSRNYLLYQRRGGCLLTYPCLWAPVVNRCESVSLIQEEDWE